MNDFQKEFVPAPREKFDFVGMRKRHGLTQADLAMMLKVSKNYICQIETNRKVPSDSLVALAERVDRELAAKVTGANGSAAPGPGMNPAQEYLQKVWNSAQGDKYLEGYIVTQLKLVFPLNSAPFSVVED